MTRPPAPVSERTPLSTAPPPPAVAPAETAREREPEAPPAPTYTVKRGDTLAQIALDAGLDYRELASWNGIENPNVIRVGQVLVMAAPGSAPSTIACARHRRDDAAGRGAADRARRWPSPRRRKSRRSCRRAATIRRRSRPSRARSSCRTRSIRWRRCRRSAAAQPAPPVVAAAPVRRAARAGTGIAGAGAAPSSAPASPPAALPSRPDAARVPEIDDDKLGWIWPSQGKVIAGFSDSANLKGIDIAGKVGQPVVASAAGRVVYAGSGLRGYGKLIIVKHNSTFLSAYAHNRELVVKEGQQVVAGAEDQRDGRHRRRSGEAALRDPPARQARRPRRSILPPV